MSKRIAAIEKRCKQEVREIKSVTKKRMPKYMNQLGAFALIIIFCVVNVISFSTISHMEGNARVINYIGIVRGATQRLVKQEMNQVPNDELIQYLDDIISELSTGEGKYDLIALPDKTYQNLLKDLSEDWIEIKEEITAVRQGGDAQHLFGLSESYFIMADRTVTAAENYSEKSAKGARLTLLCLDVGFIILGVLFWIYRRWQKNIEEALDMVQKESKAKSEFL